MSLFFNLKYDTSIKLYFHLFWVIHSVNVQFEVISNRLSRPYQKTKTISLDFSWPITEGEQCMTILQGKTNWWSCIEIDIELHYCM